MQKPVIQVKNLTKKFGKFTAVDGITFSVYPGEIVGFLGPNGAGKTTTIQMLLDLVTPTSGTIRMFGLDMKKSREEILNRVNFSSAYVAMPSNLKVWENLSTFGRLYGVRDIKNKVKELAAFFEVSDMLSKMTGSLSSGQSTRVNLAKALINDPELLLLDEPTASLDPDVADKVRKLLLKIQKERGVTVLYTSHNMAEIEEICNRVVFINKGKITDSGTPNELIKKYGRKDMNEVFLAITRGEE
ncbi:MAG: ABC transporter ATP-binding protein [bacterium]|nr:ABC transporter ATP-binding protein [bacterium]